MICEVRENGKEVVLHHPIVHGCWVLVDTNEEQFFVCSKCGKKEYWESDYCPNCGCRMDGEDGESDGTKS